MTQPRLAALLLGPLMLAIGLLAAAPAAHAQGAVKIDLNKLEPRDGACRAYFVVENATGSAFTGFTLDLFLFGGDGVVSKRIVVDSAPLDAAKIRVRPVDFREVDCADISMILVNDIIKCVDDSGERDDCVGLLELTNRTSAKFVK